MNENNSHFEEPKPPADAERYRRWVESLTDYVYTVQVKNGEAVSTTHSPGCLRVTGYSPEEYQCDKNLWINMVHRSDRQAVIDQARRTRAGELPGPIEHRIWHKDGSLRWVSNIVIPMLDAEGRVTAYDGFITDITQRKHTEEALRESEKKYHALVEAAGDAILIEDLKLNILDCNEAACRIFGYTRQELTQLKVTDLVPRAVSANLSRLVTQVSREGKLRLEAVNLRKDGSEFPCEVTLRLITVEGEKRLIAYIHDLTEHSLIESTHVREMEAQARAQAAETARNDLEREIAERKKAQKALQESEERFRRTFEQAAVGIAHVSPEGTFLRINQRFCEITGYSQSEMLERTFQDITHPEDLDADLEYVRQMLANERRSYQMEKRYIRKDGGQVWINLTVSLVRSSKGEVRYFISVVEDISRRKQMEKALQNALLRLKEMEFIVTNSNVIAFLWRNQEGWPVDFVTENISQFGYEAGQFTSGKILYAEIIHPEDVARVAEEIRAYLAQGQSHFVQEYRILTRKGEPRWLEDNTWVRRSPDGQVTHLQGILSDVTDHKRMEQYMLRTERLAAMGHMAAELAHEIKNPLQAINSHLELVLDFDLPPEDRDESLRFCRQEVNRLSEISMRILSFTRTAQDSQFTPTSIRNLVDQALALAGDAIHRIRAQVMLILPADLPLVTVVPSQMVQVLLNLVLNALEAMGTGGILRIHASCIGNEVTVSLTNTGPAIPKHDLEHLFEPFFTTKRDSNGLGLFVSQNIIAQHGGRLIAENLPDGQGVCFSICLPTECVQHPGGIYIGGGMDSGNRAGGGR